VQAERELSVGRWPPASVAPVWIEPPRTASPEAPAARSVGVALATVTCRVVRAADEPVQDAVCPVNTNAVEHPSSSVTVSVAVYVPA
jgi:hypothetical protein